jgi:aminopeptidase N
VLFDPDGWVLKGLRFKKEKEELLFQVKRAPYIIARIQACEELGKIAHDVEVADELGKVLRTDRFYGVRANAARALGEIGTPDAKRNILPGMKDKDSRVRRAAAESLGSFRDEDVVSILADAFKGERKHYAAASIILGLGMTRLPSAYDKILLGLKRDSHNSVVAANVFNALVELRDERGIELAKKYTVYGQPNAVRQAAILCLGKLGELFDKRSEEVREFLIPILKDPSHVARSATIFALDALGDVGAIRYLYPAMEGEALGLIRRVARRAIRHIREKDGEKRAQKADVAKELEEVKKENKDLKIRMEKIEERIKALGEKRGKKKKRK